MQSSSQVMCLCVCVLALVLTLFTSVCGEALLGLFLLQQRVCLGYLEGEGCGIQTSPLWSFKINLCHCCCGLELSLKADGIDLWISVNFPLAAENHLVRLRGTERWQWDSVVEPWEAQVADASNLVNTSQLSPDFEKVPVILLLWIQHGQQTFLSSLTSDSISPVLLDKESGMGEMLCFYEQIIEKS